jgi:hypothetical protein
MHAVIISRHLKNSLKRENLGYNLGSYIGGPISEADPSSAPLYFAKVNLF